MVMPGRSYSATSQYRYGFNGKENDKDIASDNYDFGARVYDGRLGRWLSKDAIDLVGWNPYHFATNNPIRYFDSDGNIQTDPSGKVIFTPVSYSPDLHLPSDNSVRKTLLKNADRGLYQNALVIKGYIYTDKGTPVEAYKVLGYYETEVLYGRDKNGNETRTNVEVFRPAIEKPGIIANCYGDCTAYGQVYIPNESGMLSILRDEYTAVKNKNVDKVKVFKVGDVIKVGVDHYIKATRVGSDGNMVWSSDFSIDERTENSLSNIIKSLQKSEYHTLEGQDFSLKNATLFRKNKKDRERKDGTPMIPAPVKRPIIKNVNREQEQRSTD